MVRFSLLLWLLLLKAWLRNNASPFRRISELSLIRFSQPDDTEFRRRKRLVLAEEAYLFHDCVRGQFRVGEVPVLRVPDDERVADDAPVAELESGRPTLEMTGWRADSTHSRLWRLAQMP